MCSVCTKVQYRVFNKVMKQLENFEKYSETNSGGKVVSYTYFVLAQVPIIVAGDPVQNAKKV